MDPSTPQKLIEDVTFLFPQESAWGWLWLLAAALAAAGGGWLIRFRKKFAAGGGGILAAETALRSLGELETSLETMSAADFSIEVSKILRRYFEEEFARRALHQSTEEFLWEVAEEGVFLTSGESSAIGDFLRSCDRAKFALHDLDQTLRRSLFGMAREFVLNKREASQPAPGR